MIEQPIRTPHKKQVWVSKPNHLRNTLDTLPDISSDPLPRAPQPTKKSKTHKQTPPKREVIFHYDYCEREGNLAALCFRRNKDEWRVSGSSRRNTNCPSHGVHDFLAQRRTTRPRCALPLAARPQAVRPHVPNEVLVVCHMAKDPVIEALVLTFPAEHDFLLMVIALPIRGHGCLVFSLILFRGKCRNTGILHSLLTPVMCHLLTLCLSIGAGQRSREHVAHGFRLFVSHDRKQQMVLHPRPCDW
jgi:hypothetical protein